MSIPANIRPIPGHDGYFVSIDGMIYSRCHKGLRQLHTYIVQVEQSGKIRTEVRVSLGKNASRLRVHRLVCATFHGPPPSSRHRVVHLNGDYQDNRAANLAWAPPGPTPISHDFFGPVPWLGVTA